MFTELKNDIIKLIKIINNSFLIKVIKKDFKDLWIDLTTNETRFSYLLLLIIDIYSKKIKEKIPKKWFTYYKYFKRYLNAYPKDTKKFIKLFYQKTKTAKFIKSVFLYIFNILIIRALYNSIRLKLHRINIYTWRFYRDTRDDIYWGWYSSRVVWYQIKETTIETYYDIKTLIPELWERRHENTYYYKIASIKLFKLILKKIYNILIQTNEYTKDPKVFVIDFKKFTHKLWIDLVVKWKFKYKNKIYWLIKDNYKLIKSYTWDKFEGDNIIEKLLLLRVNLQLDRLTNVHGPIEHLHWRKRYQIERYRKVNSVLNEILNRLFVTPIFWWILWVPFCNIIFYFVVKPIFNVQFLNICFRSSIFEPFYYITIIAIIIPLFYQFYLYLYKGRNWEQNVRNRYRF